MSFAVSPAAEQPWWTFTPETSEAGLTPAVSLAALARFLSPTAVSRDWLPGPPWLGGSRRPVARPTRPSTMTDPRAVPGLFRAAVAACAGPAERVAVSLSGGIDSLAVLAALVAAGERRIVAVTSDSVDEAGRSPAALVRRQLGALGGRVELRTVGYRLRDRPLPSWRAAGPGFHATPREHRALADEAAAAGAEVLLYGGGADQLLAFPRFRAAARAWPGIRGTSRALERLVDLRRPGAAVAWWALQISPGYRRAAGPELLAEPVAATVRHEFHAFATAQVAHHQSQGWGLRRAAAFERLYPHDRLPAATELPLRSPFYDADLARAAWAVPMTARWDPRLPADNQRAKRLVVDLVPRSVRATLPTTTMLSRDHAADYWREERVEPTLLLAYGLLHERWRDRLRSLYDLQMVAECEWWLREALDRGHRVAEDLERKS